MRFQGWQGSFEAAAALEVVEVITSFLQLSMLFTSSTPLLLLLRHIRSTGRELWLL